MKVINGTKLELEQCAKRANVDRGWPEEGRQAVETDRIGIGIHVPFELVVTSYKAAITPHPKKNGWALRVENSGQLEASDRGRGEDEPEDDWEPKDKIFVAKK